MYNCIIGIIPIHAPYKSVCIADLIYHCLILFRLVFNVIRNILSALRTDCVTIRNCTFRLELIGARSRTSAQACLECIWREIPATPLYKLGVARTCIQLVRRHHD